MWLVVVAVIAACLFVALIAALVVLASWKCEDSEQAHREVAVEIRGVVEEAKGEIADVSDDYLRQVYEQIGRQP